MNTLKNVYKKIQEDKTELKSEKVELGIVQDFNKIASRLKSANSTLNKAISNFKQYIKNETLAESISLINQTQDGIELEFDKIKISVLIKKIT